MTFWTFFSYFSQKIDIDVYADCLLRRQFALNIKVYFLWKIRKKYQFVICWICSESGNGWICKLNIKWVFISIFGKCIRILSAFFCACFWKHITKTCLFKYIENFTTKKEYFQIKNSDIFPISAQNIDCWYSLELFWWGSSNENPLSMLFSKIRKKCIPL